MCGIIISSISVFFFSTDKKNLLPHPNSASNLNHERLEASQDLAEDNDQLGFRKTKPEHRNSNTSTTSLHTIHKEFDTASIASFDSAISTPSPTPPKYERNSSPPNPFTFTHADKGMSSPCIRTPDPMQIQTASATVPIQTPRTRLVPTRPVNPPSSPYHVSQVNTSLGACPGKPPSTSDASGHSFSVLDPHPHPPPPPMSPTRDLNTFSTNFDEQMDLSHSHPSSSSKSSVSSSSSLLSTSSLSSSSSTSTITPPPSSPSSLPTATQNLQKSQLLRPLSCPGEGSHSSGEGHRKRSFDDLRSKPSCNSSPAIGTHYMNLHNGSERVDMSTKPDEPPTYMNLGEKDSHYQNPVMREPAIDCIGPRVPPKPQPPQVPPRTRKVPNFFLKNCHLICLHTWKTTHFI